VFQPYVVPVAVAILMVVFGIQRYGTHKVGRLFGPVMVVWFSTLIVLGISWIVRAPEVLGAVNPAHAVSFFRDNGLHGFVVLGAVFLVVTGGEALYADMGHFGRRPIRIAWFSLVLPALLINYFGQGALLLIDPAAAQPFFQLAPTWALYPLVALATCAAIIASQALISGAFSLTRQAIQLGYAPRLDVEHTSSWEMGQIYVPQVNWFLAISCILIVISFGSSAALTAAYGIAVALTMVITGVLLPVVARQRWGWPAMGVAAFAAIFVTIDLAYVGGNLFKVAQGGWLPLAIATLIFTLMTTWKTGRRLVAERLTARAFPLEEFVSAVAANLPTRVTGTAVFMTAQPTGTPAALAHNLRYNKILHDHVVVLTVTTAPVPHMPDDERVTVQPMGHGIYNAKVQYGFMEDPDVPDALRRVSDLGVPIDPEDVTYFLGRETIVVSSRGGMATWREKLFVLMARNAVRATAFFRLPPERVVELGVQVEI
jgi:KUP system potassium uptake protein